MMHFSFLIISSLGCARPSCLRQMIQRLHSSATLLVATSEKLKLVQIDVWGLVHVSSLSGSHYYVTFINDATRGNWVYCIRQKSVVFDTFKKWKYLAENETGKG